MINGITETPPETLKTQAVANPHNLTTSFSGHCLPERSWRTEVGLRRAAGAGARQSMEPISQPRYPTR
jgi:hypothetical protein